VDCPRAPVQRIDELIFKPRKEDLSNKKQERVIEGAKSRPGVYQCRIEYSLGVQWRRNGAGGRCVNRRKGRKANARGGMRNGKQLKYSVRIGRTKGECRRKEMGWIDEGKSI
jgi:hypothetical protein